MPILRSSSSSPQSRVTGSPAGESPEVRDISGLDRVRAETRARASEPYLLSVTSGGRPHCGTVTVTWDDDRLAIWPVPRKWAEAEAAGYRQVTLLWPPTEAGGYNLIVDGIAASTDQALLVTVTRAVLHRRGPAPADSSSSCGSDCVPLTG